MKRLLCMLLAILLTLCACQSAADTTTESSIHTPFQNATDTAASPNIPETAEQENDADPITEETVPVSSVRYQNVYKTTELAVNGYISKLYEKDGFLYVQTREPVENNRYRFTLSCFDDSGIQTAQYVLTPSVEVPSEACMYRLSDGRFLVSDGQGLITYRGKENIGALYLFSEDGILLNQVTFDSHSGQVHIIENEDGSLGFLAVAKDYLYLFDGDLNQLRQVSADRFQLELGFRAQSTIADIGHGRYLFGAQSEELFVYDSSLGTTNFYRMRLPKSYDNCSVFLQSQGGTYLINNRGIEKYRATGDQPTLLFDWLDCGSGRLTTIDNEILMLNDNTMVYSASEQRNGRTETVLRMIRAHSEPLPDDVQLITVRHTSTRGPGNDWFEKAVMAFNAQNNGYKVKVLYPASYMEHDECTALIAEDLLYDSGVDIFITPHHKEIVDFYDKTALVDLMPYFGEAAADCIPTAFGVDGALYIMPLGMDIMTFTAPTAIMNHELTWEDMYHLTDTLDSDTALMTGDGSLVNRLRNNGLMSYFDRKTQKSWYDSDSFRKMVTYLEKLSYSLDRNIGYITANGDMSSISYGLTNATLARRLREGGLCLLGTPMVTVEAVALLKLLYGDTDYTYCGFPDTDCSGAYISGNLNVSIAQNTDVLDGCLAFLSFMLSDEIQTDDRHLAVSLPVTDSALEKALSQYRYVYYDKDVYNKLETPSTENLSVAADGYTTEYQDDFGLYHDTSYYHVIEITEEDRDAFLDFLSKCRMKDTLDDTVRSIVTEELSYWQNNARSLEETTKIIDSRVWIYLNE